MLNLHWDISPYIGVGPLLFGASRTEARAVVPGIPSPFVKGAYTSIEADAYDDLGLHLYYDSDYRLRCAMAFGAELFYFRGMSLTDQPLQDALDRLLELGISCRYRDEGYWCDGGGFVLYSADDIVKAITVFRKGYYEEEMDLAATI